MVNAVKKYQITEKLSFDGVTTAAGNYNVEDISGGKLTGLSLLIKDYKKVEYLDENSLTRELLLIKIKNDLEHRQEVLSAIQIFGSKIVDYSVNAICVEITGEPSKINAFIDILKPYGIIEMCRTGIVALERGESSILAK